jgi:hypothetical protein
MATTKTPAKKAAAKKAAAPKAKTVKALVPCKCHTTQVGDVNGTPQFGPCGAETKRDFAPGHDARLKGLLIRLHVASQVYLVRGQSPQDPMDVARERQWGGYLTAAKDREGRRAVAKVNRDKAAAERKADAAKVKAARDAEKAAAKAKATAAKPAKPAAIATPIGGTVGVRIGRHTYTAKVTSEGPGEITVDYTDSKGAAKTGVVVKRSNVVAAAA